jgi:hypothetical protein
MVISTLQAESQITGQFVLVWTICRLCAASARATPQCQHASYVRLTIPEHGTCSISQTLTLYL